MVALIEIASDLQISLESPPPPMRSDLADRVEALWRDFLTRTPGGFDGQVALLDVPPAAGEAPAQIPALTVRPVPYRMVRVGEREPDIRAALGGVPLGVAAALETPDGVLVGRRGVGASDAAVGRWDLMPAGSLDCREGGVPDPVAQILRELGGETGLPEAAARDVRPRWLALDHEAWVADIVFQMRTDYDLAELTARQQSLPAPREHTALRCLRAAELADFLAHEEMTGVTRAVLTMRQ